MKQIDLNKLVEKVIADDRMAEKELVAYYEQEVDAIVRWRIGKANPDCEDLKQEILTAFILRIKENKYDRQKGTLGAFLHSTMKFKIMDYQKSPAYTRRHVFEDVSKLKLENEGKNPEEAVMNSEARLALKNAIRNLKNPYKEILHLAIYHQLPVKEISKRLGLPADKISNLKSYALSLIKAELRKTLKISR